MKLKPANLRNIRAALESVNPISLRHHIQGQIQITEAKPLGFGTKSIMVKFHRGLGWTTIDPVTWEIV
jgi:hypothetical protein